MTLALVTGASRGIGFAIASDLAARGVDLALISRSKDALTAAAAAIGDDTPDSPHQRAIAIRAYDCDLADAAHACRTVDAVIGDMGVPDIVINNAGWILRAPVRATTTEAWDEHMAVNLRAPFVVSRQCLPGMLARRSGRLVHIGSVSSTLGTAAASAYCAAKWGLLGFMKSLAEELTDTGVTTMALLPGSVGTRMLEGSGFAPRMTASDVAKTAVFYALDAPDAHNGGVVELFGT